MASPEEEFIEPNLLRAMGHPLRVKILDVLNEREASPNELKDILGVKLGHVAYHTRVLVKCHCLEMTRTEQRRGATEHFYRARPESLAGRPVLQGVPRSLKGTVAVASLKVFVGKLMAALKAGTIHDNDGALNSMTISLDEIGQVEAEEIVQGVLEQLKEVDKASRRRAGSDKLLIPHVAGLALFAAAPRHRAEDSK